MEYTPLNAVHRELGAKMVAFVGWDMPLHYGSQIEEHLAVRRAAGMFDVSHMLAVDIIGSGAGRFLRTLLANDVAKLTVSGKALYSCMLNDAGGVLDDLIVYFLGADRYRVVVNAATAAKDVKWMETLRARLASDVEILPRRDVAMIAVQGPQARERVWHVRPQWRAASESLPAFQAAIVHDAMIARTGYTGEDGFEIMLPAADAEPLWRALAGTGVAPCGLGARDTLRLEAGMNLYGQDMDETVTPLESGLGWTVAMAAARNFIGKTALAGRVPSRKQLGLVLIDKGVLRAHQNVRCASGEGEITSGGYAPTLRGSIALARLPLAVQAGEEVDIEVRDKWLRAKAVKPPFVRNGQIMTIL